MTLLRPAASAVVAISLSLLALPAAAQDAAATYKAKCAMCHGADGKGDTPAGKKVGVHDFASDEVQKQSDNDLGQIIFKGKNKMPAYESKLKPEEVKDLIAYIRKLGKSH
ncbi:MAG TPA: cytochrome c [Terriglobales bacterium]|jgi:mono/diheme cytochrome c family protein|nr:cytochrome c [Terriglobales bacterium]